MKELSNNKVMVFGDSVSKGVVYDGRELSVLDNGVVKEVADHYRVEFKNISVYGQTLKRLYDRRIIDKHLKEMSDEDAALTYVVLVIGGNDCDFDWAAVARAPSVKHIPKTSLDAFEKMLVDSIEKIKKRGAMPVVCTTPPINPQKYFSNVICTVADCSKVMEFLNGDLTNISRYHECYNLAIVKCALENNCRLIDLRTPLLLDRKYMDLLCPDGIHPNEQGHMLMAKVVENIIDGMLKRSASGK